MRNRSVKIRSLKLSVTNCFLVETDDQRILVDTGYEYEWELFCKRLDETNTGLSEISHLILTHHHNDHSGMLNKIVSSNKDIRLVMSHHAADLLRKGRHYHLPGSGYVNRRVNLLLSLKGRFDKRWTHTFPPYQVREKDILVEGETALSDIGIAMDGKIIETPGHSIDSISLVFGDGQCIVGDAAANFLQWAGTRYCIISIDNLHDYYASWEKLIAENGQVIHPAHGKEFRIEALKRNLGKHTRLVPFA